MLTLWYTAKCEDVQHQLGSDHMILEIQNYTVTIIITVVISVIVLFIIILVIIVCTCLCCKYKRSSKATPDGKTVDIQSSQPTQPMPVYETVMESATVDLEITENVAYAPVHTLSRKT